MQQKSRNEVYPSHQALKKMTPSVQNIAVLLETPLSLQDQRDSPTSFNPPLLSLWITWQKSVFSVLDGDFAYVMGLVSYGFKPDKVRIISTPAKRVRSAARFFHRACKLDKKEAFRFYGDIFFDGIGAQRCYKRAVSIYKKGVIRDDADAKFALGWCYDFGCGVSRCPRKAVHLYREAMKGGCQEAYAEYGYLKLIGHHIRSNHNEAASLLKKANEMGAFLAKSALGWCYERGIGVNRDPRKAFELYKESFSGGDLLTTVELAACYDNGVGVEKDPRKAAMVYERCANAGTWHSDLYRGYYGLRLIRGLGVKKNVERGKKIILNATKTRNSISWNSLGDCYRYGYDGFSKNLRLAEKFYRKATECENDVFGIVNSYIALGEMYENSECFREKRVLASKYYLEAANMLHPVGQWKVANAFETGNGLEQDVYKAVTSLGSVPIAAIAVPSRNACIITPRDMG